MKPQFDNQVMSSMLLWFDNKLLTKGEAYQNTTGQFYSVSDEFYGYDTYASTYSQIVADASVTGATIPTGFVCGRQPSRRRRRWVDRFIRHRLQQWKVLLVWCSSSGCYRKFRDKGF